MPFIICGCCGAEIFVSLRGKDAEISYTELIHLGKNNCEVVEE